MGMKKTGHLPVSGSFMGCSARGASYPFLDLNKIRTSSLFVSVFVGVFGAGRLLTPASVSPKLEQAQFWLNLIGVADGV